MKFRETPNRKTFWVTNITSRSVMLSDLNVSIRAMSLVDLLDIKHYPHLNEAILEKSLASGSLYQKRALVRKRLVEPKIDLDNKLHANFQTATVNEALIGNKLQMDKNAALPSRQRSVLEVKIEEYAEMQLSDDKEEMLKKEFDAIAENADTVAYDTQPLIPKK